MWVKFHGFRLYGFRLHADLAAPRRHRTMGVRKRVEKKDNEEEEDKKRRKLAEAAAMMRLGQLMKDKTEREECEARRKEEEEEEEDWGPEWRSVEDSEEMNGIFRVDSEPEDEEWEDEMCSRVSRRMGEEWAHASQDRAIASFHRAVAGEPEAEEEKEEEEKEEEEMEEEEEHQTDDVPEPPPEEEPEEQEQQQPAGSTINTNWNPDNNKD